MTTDTNHDDRETPTDVDRDLQDLATTLVSAHETGTLDLTDWPRNDLQDAVHALLKAHERRSDALSDAYGRLGPWTTTNFRWVCDRCPAHSAWIRRDHVTDVLEAAHHHHEDGDANLHVEASLSLEHPVVIERRSMVDLTLARNLDNPEDTMVQVGGGGYREAPFLDRDTTAPPTDEELGLTTPQPTHDELVGIPASPGTATGQAVHIDPDHVHTVDKDDLPEDWVLLAPYTDPRFTPLMRDANAIATLRGGLSSHASHTARELHTPCVVALTLPSGLDTLAPYHGDHLHVDGDAGTIHLQETRP